ncbi:calcium-binding protein, partial [Singulisphaera rosea]
MDLNGFEALNFNALGGADTITVNDLTGTGLTQVNLNLAGTVGGNTGDGQADNVIVNGTDGDDVITAGGSAAGVSVLGLAARVDVKNIDAALDKLTVNGLGGDDTIDASSLAANLVSLVINGGIGIDTIFGSKGADLVNGGSGNDVVFLGDGDDTFVWNPGDGSDTVEGQGGNDTLLFNGANVNEKIAISANGSRVRFTRDVANITMDLNGFEALNFNALGGADTITVNDLTGTGLTQVNLNLAGTVG